MIILSLIFVEDVSFSRLVTVSRFFRRKVYLCITRISKCVLCK